MSIKGEKLLNEKLNKDVEKNIDFEDIFGTQVITGFDKDVNGLNEYVKSKEPPKLREAKEIELFGTEDLNADFVRKQKIREEQANEVKEEKVTDTKVTNDLYAQLFSDFEIEEVSGHEHVNPLEIPKTEDVVIQEPVVNETVDEDFELPEGMSNLELERIKELTNSENYPSFFPNFKEILELKKKHEDIILVITGNLFEQFHYNIQPELFICTTFKSSDYFEFVERGGVESDIGLFYPFILTRSVLFPKIEFEDVFNIPAGTLQKIVDNILINSKYKTSIEVIKI